MTFLLLILRNLSFYRKSWLAIFAGTVISVAVLTGALVVGDSVRYSLSQLTDVRLGKIRFAIQTHDRFFRQQLADELAETINSPVAAVLHLEGIALNTDKNTRINQVEVLGVDEHFLKLWNTSASGPSQDEAYVSQNTALKMKLKPGDEILLKIRKRSKAPENAPFVSEKEPLVSFRLKVASVVSDSQTGRFSLKTNQSAPFNIFVSLELLAHKVNLDGDANLLLVADNETNNLSSQKLDSLLRRCWQPEDAGLVLRNLPGNNLYEIRSERIFIDENTAGAIRHVVPEANPVLTYLANSISNKSLSTPYSFVTAADIPGYNLSEKEIIINNWLATDLAAKPGDSLEIKYYKMGALRKLTEESARFCIKTILPINNPIFDRSLMPDFPGMTDAGNCRDWETGAPVNLDKIREKDEQYWNEHRGTPKAFISIRAGQKLWENPFGTTTAFRFQADSPNLPLLKNKLMNRLVPAESGLQFENVYVQGKEAATNSTDFGELFLSLSFFILLAALILTALLFSLHAQKRLAESAVMAVTGFRKKQILQVLFIEASLVILLGSAFGTLAGVLYNKLLLLGLNTLWNDAVRTSMLQVHLVFSTLILGFASGVVIALLTILFVLLRNFRNPLSQLVKGIIIPVPAFRLRREKASLAMAFLLTALAAASILYSLISQQADLSEMFLSAGGMILLAGIVFLYYLLLLSTRKTVASAPGFFLTILRSISLRKNQVITSVALLAIGTFSIVITGANRKSFYGTENNPKSGTGGFLFWAESTIPVQYDLNTPEGKAKYGLADEPVLRDVRFLQIPRLTGNDASCLNLNQVSKPAILGINPAFFDQRQAFSFTKLATSCDRMHPWLKLNTALAPGVIPCFADQSVITYGMQKNIGDTLIYSDENGQTLKMILMGGLDNSIFQGNILISAELLQHYFPSIAGSGIMLIDGDFDKRKEISSRIEYLFQDFGLTVTLASERLAEFNSVENTYLSVFMLLGGLGVVLGTFGLGIVVLRNIRERQAEMSLYLAIGFRRRYIFKILATEYLMILVSGTLIGTVSALIGLLPSIINTSTRLPWELLAVILLVVMLSGLLWIIFPIKNALEKNIILSLRTE